MSTLPFALGAIALTLILAIVVSVVGGPVHVVMVVALVACVVIHLWMGHGDPNGAELLETARRAGSADTR